MSFPARLAVTVAVLTYRRPDDLAELLPMVAAQLNSDNFEAEIVVVDNDPAGGAGAMVAAMADERIRYAHEPTPGIAAGRNRALDEAASADLVVFIDDDERPCDGWLALLVRAYLVGRPPGVVGPVISEFEIEPEPWVRLGRFFERNRWATGTGVEVAATNNLLLDMACLRRLGVRFDPRFGISGGSDTLFTRTITRSAGSLIWCDEAIVIDRVPAARVTRSWVLRRAFRSGNSWSLTTLELSDSTVARMTDRIRLLAIGAVRAVGGACRLALGAATRSMSLRARGLRTAARGAGMMSGACGYVYSEYRRRPPASLVASR